jgi:AraC family ethanolamine operon transcriptional activator
VALSNFGKVIEACMHHVETKLSTEESTLQSAPVFRTVSTRDADDLARNLSGWQQSYDQISAGRFQGTLAELCLPRLQIFRETINQSVRQSCRVLPGSLWFGFPDNGAHRGDGDGNRINGRKVESDCVMLHAGNSEFELHTGSSHAIYGVVVCQKWLMEQAATRDGQIDWSNLYSGDVLRASASARAACVAVIQALLQYQPQRHGAGADLQPALLHTLLQSLLAMLGEGGVLPAKAGSFQRRQRIVSNVRDYVLSHLDQAITVPHMCEQAHVSRRTLQYCFEDVVGMSPTQYLRRVRLNGVRRQLRYPQCGKEAIGSVASNWGFDNFSQFSSDYRKLFGSCASAAS